MKYEHEFKKENKRLVKIIESRLGVENTTKILTALTVETSYELIKINRVLENNKVIEKFRALQANFDSLKNAFNKLI